MFKSKPRFTSDEIASLKELVRMLSESNINIRDLVTQLQSLSPAPSSGPQAGIQSSTTTPPSTPILSDDRAEDVSFRGTTVHNSLIRHRSNNFNGRSDGRVYIPPVGVSAFVDSKFSGNSVILSQCNNNNGPGFGNDTT